MKQELIKTPEIGEFFQGGYVAGELSGNLILVAPKNGGQIYGKTWDEATKWVKNLSLGGYKDWVIPSEDELNLVYQNLGPNHTKISEFRKGDSEAIWDNKSNTSYVWTSTEYSASLARFQSFNNGNQSYNPKNYTRYLARAIRKVPLNSILSS